MDDLQILVLSLVAAMMFGGLVVGCSLIRNWPGRTPADPE